MGIVTTRHNNLFHENFDKLCEDKGQEIFVYVKVDGRLLCTWCKHDYNTGRSAGIPKNTIDITQDLFTFSGYIQQYYWIGQWLDRTTSIDWSTHPRYQNHFTCPECGGVGYTNNYFTVSLPNIIVDDLSETLKRTNASGILRTGMIVIYGKLSDILSGTDNTTDTIFDHALTIKVDGTFYRLGHLKKLGLRDWYIYEAYLVRMDNRWEL
jgi:hypothetical protein